MSCPNHWHREPKAAGLRRSQRQRLSFSPASVIFKSASVALAEVRCWPAPRLGWEYYKAPISLELWGQIRI